MTSLTTSAGLVFMRAFLRTSPRKLSQITISADMHGLVRNNAMSRE